MLQTVYFKNFVSFNTGENVHRDNCLPFLRSLGYCEEEANNLFNMFSHPGGVENYITLQGVQIIERVIFARFDGGMWHDAERGGVGGGG